jgi:acetyl-CoA carboxylase biotin carboxyl carrier protein
MEIKTDMAGLVESVLVAVGDVIETGQKILLLESMKTIMEVNSPSDGKVIEIKCESGDFVDEGDILVILG